MFVLRETAKIVTACEQSGQADDTKKPLVDKLSKHICGLIVAPARKLGIANKCRIVKLGEINVKNVTKLAVGTLFFGSVMFTSACQTTGMHYTEWRLINPEQADLNIPSLIPAEMIKKVQTRTRDNKYVENEVALSSPNAEGSVFTERFQRGWYNPQVESQVRDRDAFLERVDRNYQNSRQVEPISYKGSLSGYSAIADRKSDGKACYVSFTGYDFMPYNGDSMDGVGKPDTLVSVSLCGEDASGAVFAKLYSGVERNAN